MKQLVEKRNELAAKSAALAEIFAEGKTGGAELDLEKVTKLGDGLTTSQKAAKIRERNDELAALGKEIEALVAVESALADQKAREELLAKGRPITHPDPMEKRGAAGPNAKGISLARLFVESPSFKEFKTGKGPTTEIDLDDPKFGGVEIKALLDTTGFVPEAVRSGLILPTLMRRPTIADLIPQGTTGQNAIKFMEETTATNAIAPTAEGTAKPESALAFTERVNPVRKIAGVLPITDELMEDEPAMRSYIEARLRVFLNLAEETQLVSGSGTAPEIRGLMNIAGIQTQAKGADPVPDAVYKAMTKIRTVAFLEPTGLVIHPDDWTDIRLLKTTDGIYIWGSPSEAGPERIWGMPVVQSPALTVNTAIVAAFDTSMQIFRRNQVSFAVSDQHLDYFVKNLLMLRIEERLAFCVFRPTGICTVTGI